MKRSIYVLILIFMFLCVNNDAIGGAVTPVQVSVGKVSEVVFPVKVSKVIKGGAPDSVLVEVLDNSIYLLPKSNTPADIFVTTVSGESFPLDLNISAQHDIRVQVAGGKHRLERTSSVEKSDVMELLKEILGGKEPAGATILKSDSIIDLNNAQIRVSIEVIYELSHMTAYVLRAQNITDNSVIVPTQEISFPNLLAVSTDSDMLGPKGQIGDTTKVYLISGR